MQRFAFAFLIAIFLTACSSSASGHVPTPIVPEVTPTFPRVELTPHATPTYPKVELIPVVADVQLKSDTPSQPQVAIAKPNPAPPMSRNRPNGDYKGWNSSQWDQYKSFICGQASGSKTITYHDQNDLDLQIAIYAFKASKPLVLSMAGKEARYRC